MNNKEAIKVLQKRLNENARYFNKFAKVTDDYYKQFVLKYRLALLHAIKALRAIDNTPDVLYLCDHKSCKRGITYGANACDPCGHTQNIRHAANFEPLNDNDGRILAYVEHAQKENPQGDLISREALIEEHSKECIHNCYYCRHFKWSKKMACSYCDVIDNAPTVPDHSLEIAQKSIELGRRLGRTEERVENKRAYGKWIPIKTRELTEEEKEEYPDYTFMYDCKLPEDGEEVLVTKWNGDTALDTFCRDDSCYFENYYDEGDVIAWMPKPEPYKEGGAE